MRIRQSTLLAMFMFSASVFISRTVIRLTLLFGLLNGVNSNLLSIDYENVSRDDIITTSKIIGYVCIIYLDKKSAVIRSEMHISADRFIGYVIERAEESGMEKVQMRGFLAKEMVIHGKSVREIVFDCPVSGLFAEDIIASIEIIKKQQQQDRGPTR